jgi:hypothetical protein
MAVWRYGGKEGCWPLWPWSFQSSFVVPCPMSSGYAVGTATYYGVSLLGVCTEYLRSTEYVCVPYIVWTDGSMCLGD